MPPTRVVSNCVSFICIALSGARLAAQPVVTTSAGAPQQVQRVLFPQPLSPRIANYDIDVRLDTKTRELKATERLVWHNRTAQATAELQFHLYLNAFRNDRSTFMRESGGMSRGNRIDKDGWGYIEVERIQLAGSGQDLTAALAFIQPDDDNRDDKTVARLPLPRPVAPGESIAVAIDFTAKLPQPPFARTGAKKEFFMVAQWFPKVGVFENGRWNTHQFHANSEFFADYGVYNVRMTVPAENLVGATGVEVAVIDNRNGTKTHVYRAEDVHDFAWTTSPEFVEFKDRVQDVDIRLLLQPDHVDQAVRHLEATRVAVEYFQNWYGDYPFPNLTVVDPRRGAAGAGGMEYPTLITAGTSYGLPAGVRAVETVIIHEFGHNYWYHLLGSNEFEESWLDEGINTYTEIQILNDRYGPAGDLINFLGIRINDLQVQRAVYLNAADRDRTVRRAWEYYPGAYSVNSYAKPGVLLTTLQNYLGEEKMRAAMRAYVSRWRFKHPTTRDFIAVVQEVAGQDLHWFFEQALFSNAVLDYSVERAATAEVKKGRGYDFSLHVTGADSSRAQAASFAESASTAGETRLYRSSFYVRRRGDFVFPVEIVATFANGEKVREQWDGREIWKKFTYTKPVKLVRAEVDPDRKIPLDVNYTNNSSRVHANHLGAHKLALRWLFWMQSFLDQPEMINLLAGFAF
ncbi:MAG: M1 family metallopeptidase [candidate division KSB1 bacterium]|nr:M1 family metallopeptidase [candidate division KSB1 bacterium]MDZ7275503.1 M1 family metallopeptidase [candidate division KSB1 bacterium]MDZ7286185.1 M1 family metallopeptidase [candidate division KSB1 bacterium]MDZ7296411.1 M1 family metallopeptidase [candidate division KSB1 bacterium]MDZ7309532.1 M1 family metallopeptidase [candidate division KSB1 bacterium]